jgi:hypothetical protein
MKKLHLIAWIFIAIAMTLRLLHYPLSAVFFVLGVFFLFIFSTHYAVKNIGVDLPNSLLYVSFFFLTLYLLFRLQYWPCGPAVFGFTALFMLAFFVAVICLIVHVSEKTTFRFPQIIFLLYFFCILVLSYTPSHRIYYFFNLHPLLNTEEILTNYRYWDKYSWFLYKSEKQDEAIEANANALKIVIMRLNHTHDPEAMQYARIIQDHGQYIKNKSWTSYP